ncbi:MAG: hypothetical protein ACPGVO_06160 [Spirulinaceae cyanobacterium]
MSPPTDYFDQPLYGGSFRDSLPWSEKGDTMRRLSAIAIAH